MRAPSPHLPDRTTPAPRCTAGRSPATVAPHASAFEEEVPRLTPCRSPRDVFTFMTPFAPQESAETFWVPPLDTQLQCTAPITVTRGILNSSLVHPRAQNAMRQRVKHEVCYNQFSSMREALNLSSLAVEQLLAVLGAGALSGLVPRTAE